VKSRGIGDNLSGLTGRHQREGLLEQLREIAERGLTHEALLDYPQVTMLPALAASVGAGGTEADRIRRFADVVRAGLDQLLLDEEDRLPEAVTKYFGLQAGWKGSSFARRRRGAATALNLSESAFRDKRRVGGSHENRVLETVLEILENEPVADDSRPSARVHPSQSALAPRWAERFEHYARISTRLRECAAYLEAYLNLRAEGADAPAFIGYVPVSLWAYAKFGRAYQRFIDEFGGGWAFSTSWVEVDAAEAVRACTLVSPHSWEDDSYLRVNLGRVENEELSPFVDWTRQDERAAELVERWGEWVDGCSCDPPHPRDACRTHTLIQNAEAFFVIVHTEWPRIADWYPDSAAKWRLDPAELSRRVRLPSVDRRPPWPSTIGDPRSAPARVDGQDRST